MYWENSVETFGGIIFVLDSVEGDCKCVCVCNIIKWFFINKL